MVKSDEINDGDIAMNFYLKADQSYCHVGEVPRFDARFR